MLKLAGFMEFSELEKKGLIESLGIKESDVFEARYNLLGAFEVLNRIYLRLEKEEKERRARND